MQQTACLVTKPVRADGYALLFNCTAAVRASDYIGFTGTVDFHRPKDSPDQL